jgi:transcriptional regulator GlxA family with amidase domain
VDDAAKQQIPIGAEPSFRAAPQLAPWQEKIAKRAMTSGLGGDIAIAEIAGSCRLSKGQFTRAFSNTVGVAPYQWYLDGRVERAKTLLTHMGISLAEISLECGFTDQSHFTNTFVRRVGVTPRRWRYGERPATTDGAE